MVIALLAVLTALVLVRPVTLLVVIALLAVLTALVLVRPVTLLLVSSGDCSSSCTDCTSLSEARDTTSSK